MANQRCRNHWADARNTLQALDFLLEFILPFEKLTDLGFDFSDLLFEYLKMGSDEILDWQSVCLF